MEPEEMAATCTTASFDPSRTIEPFPNCFSIWPRVRLSVRARSFSSMMQSYCNGFGQTRNEKPETDLHLRRVVAFAASHQKIFAALHADFDSVVQPVGLEGLRAIEDIVLMAQLVRNIFERLVQ